MIPTVLSVSTLNTYKIGSVIAGAERHIQTYSCVLSDMRERRRPCRQYKLAIGLSGSSSVLGLQVRSLPSDAPVLIA